MEEVRSNIYHLFKLLDLAKNGDGEGAIRVEEWKINPYIEQSAEEEKRSIENIIKEKLKEFPFLEKYIKDLTVKGTIEASLDKLLRDSNFRWKFSKVFWGFAYPKYWERSFLDSLTEDEREYMNAFKLYRKICKKAEKRIMREKYGKLLRKYRGLIRSKDFRKKIAEEIENSEEVKEILESLVMSVIRDQYLEKGKLLDYVIERLKIAKGSENQATKVYGDIAGYYNYIYNTVVTKPDEHVIFHEVGHYVLEKMFSNFERKKLQSYKAKISMRIARFLEKIIDKSYKSDRKTLLKILGRIYKNILKHITVKQPSNEFSEALADYFAEVVTGKDGEAKYFDAWKRDYGKFDENAYKKWYKFFRNYFKSKIEEKKIEELFTKNLYLLPQA